MIAADAVELQANLRQAVIHIRQQEVSLFTDQFGVLASASTFLGTLAFGGLLMSTNFLEKRGTDADHRYCSDLVGCDGATITGFLLNNATAIHVYYCLVSLGVAFNFAVVYISVYCLIFGPELAIRGAEREQKRAIKGMYEERTVALKLFWVGCFFIVLSGGALGWLKYPERSAVTMTAVFSCLLLVSVYYVAYLLTPLFEYHDAEGLDCTHLVREDDGEQDASQGEAPPAWASPARRRAASWLASAGESSSNLPQPTEGQQQPRGFSLFSALLFGGGGGGGGDVKKTERGGFEENDDDASPYAPLDSSSPRPKGAAAAPEDAEKTPAGKDRRRPSRWERFVERSRRGFSSAPPARSPANIVATRRDDDTTKAAPLVVDAVQQYGLLGDGALRIFDADGRLARTVDLAAGWTIDLDATFRGECFALRAPNNNNNTARLVLAGADVDDTQRWLRAIAANLRLDVYAGATVGGGYQRDLFSEDGLGDDDDDDAVLQNGAPPPRR
mmetsp:Transcript_9990/g.40493  ORF Transcript_9990/g.40493 Transcript_9990/m.40493 type:complete len:502 (+) Transcript_9990:41-1546(+)